MYFIFLYIGTFFQLFFVPSYMQIRSAHGLAKMRNKNCVKRNTEKWIKIRKMQKHSNCAAKCMYECVENS